MFTPRKHKRLTSTPSVLKNEWQPKCVKSEADGVVRFIKSRHSLPYSTNFEKKFYIKRNGDVINERVCYNAKLCIRNKKELTKLLNLLCSSSSDYTTASNEFFNPWQSREQPKNVKCSELIRSLLCNVITITGNDDVEDADVFLLDNFSCEAYENSLNKNNNNYSLPQYVNSSVKSMFFKKNREEINIGRINFKFVPEKMRTCQFFVTIQLYESDFGVKLSVKERLKKCLQECTTTIRRFSLPFPQCISGEVTRQNNLQELLELDIYNWKDLGYKFRNSIDESFYKQIRRKNRTLSEV